ncbi:MAG TPA: heme ABC exporter ATP-binding protein CcmA [Terriglobales bacterium]|nr:heme ABC exporter ATP-binding protein CcmA [Terriglobales bacterium]
MSLLECQSVSRFFGEAAVLRQVSFTAEAGQCLALWGANGAGKSTLLRILAGALRPSLGSATVHGAAVGTAAARRQTGFLSHQSLLHPHLSVAENLRFYAVLHGRADPAAAVAGALAQVRGEYLAARRVGELSQGMRQKAALARALLHQPCLLLLDEPFASLDVQTVDDLRASLRELRQAGMAILLSSHNRQQVESLLDGEVTLERGRLRAERPEVARA